MKYLKLSKSYLIEENERIARLLIAKNNEIVKLKTALEEIKEATAIVKKVNAENLIPEIYNYVVEVLK